MKFLIIVLCLAWTVCGNTINNRLCRQNRKGCGPLEFGTEAEAGVGVEYTGVGDGASVVVKCPANETLLDQNGNTYGPVKVTCRNGKYIADGFSLNTCENGKYVSSGFSDDKLRHMRCGKKCGELLRVPADDIVEAIGVSVPTGIRVKDLPYVMNPVPGSSMQFTISCSCPVADLLAGEVSACALVMLNTTEINIGEGLPFTFGVPFLPFTTATSPVITCNAACTSCQVDVPLGYQNYLNLFGLSSGSSGSVIGIVCAEVIVNKNLLTV